MKKQAKNNQRIHIETIRRFIKGDKDLEYKLGLFYLEYKYIFQKDEMERSKTFWSWWMNHRESIAICVLDAVGITPDDKVLEPTALEALKEAYNEHFSTSIIYKAYPSPSILKKVLKEGRTKLDATKKILENA